MRLSDEAKKLLDRNKISLLQALTFEQLINPIDYKKYLELYNSKIFHISSLGSIPDNLSDAAAILKLSSACVVSSGYIYPQKVVDIVTRGSSDTFYCPQSNKKLAKNTYEKNNERVSFISLPQVDKAICSLKEINNLANSDDSFNVEFKVSCNRLRVQITTLRQSNIHVLKNVFTALLPNPESGIVMSNRQQGYRVDGFGCCWIINPRGSASLEFCFPKHNRINDMHVNNAVMSFLAPLNLANSDNNRYDECAFGSIESLKPREYNDAFPSMQLTALQTARCCKSFLDNVEQLATEELDVALNNVVTMCEEPKTPAVHHGVMFFTPLAAGLGNIPIPNVPLQLPPAAASSTIMG